MRESIDPFEQALPEPWASRVVAFRLLQGELLRTSIQQFVADLEYAADIGDLEAEKLFRQIGVAICAQLQLNDIIKRLADERKSR